MDIFGDNGEHLLRETSRGPPPDAGCGQSPQHASVGRVGGWGGSHRSELCESIRRVPATGEGDARPPGRPGEASWQGQGGVEWEAPVPWKRFLGKRQLRKVPAGP